MMIVMAPEARPEHVDEVVARLEATGTVHAKVVPGVEQVAIAAIGDAGAVRGMGLETLNGVARVGPDTFCVIAGPCTVESRDQTLRVADAVAPHAAMLRGGAFKPRTSPFSFNGLGGPALEILAEARERTGLPIVTELTDLTYAETVAEVADVIQIGARNMQNYALLEIVGRLGKPVLLKRGLSSTLEELLMAADYVLKGGTEQVILCERGIRTFETATRFTLDLGAVPWLKLHTHLPVIVDPSHAAGDRRLVEALARGAAAVGADGIIVEVHEDPDAAMCDGPQQLYARDFPAFTAQVLAHAALAGRAPCTP
jgi:3-deoxy-7-phosphoheptulonate synthase